LLAKALIDFLAAPPIPGIVFVDLVLPMTEILLMTPQFLLLQARAEGSSLDSRWD
jgi:hypothetical protein